LRLPSLLGELVMEKRGLLLVVGLVLAPHYSSYSIGQYLERTRQGVTESGADIPVVGPAGRPAKSASRAGATSDG